jgi:hypothetical protein
MVERISIGSQKFDESIPTNLDLQEPTTDLTGTGIKISLTANENHAFGDVCYINNTGKAQLVDADAIATSSGLVMCIDETITAATSGTYLNIGLVRDDSWTWTIGGLMYITITGTSGNTLSQTAPTGEDDVVQVVGVAKTSKIIFFNPQLVQVEVKV